MPLVKCPECDSRISDKAASCPKCGHPMKSEENTSPSTIKCPSCGSTSTHIDKKGFDGGKACCGFLACGPLGFLCGQKGANELRVTCLSCKNSWAISDLDKKTTDDPGI